MVRPKVAQLGAAGAASRGGVRAGAAAQMERRGAGRRYARLGMDLRRGLLAGVALAVVLGAPARAALPGPQSPPPPGCAPTPLAALTPTTTDVCLHRVLVTEVTNAQEQNTTSFTVTDDLAADAASLPAVIGHWWPQGPPTAGMVVTLWGRLVDGAFRVDRWIELTHGTGPAPDGPYGDVRLLDVSAGRVPEHRMVWVRAVPFLLDPQDTGDGDIHVQTLMPCPGAGLTTETTPPLRGYVDHPDLGLPSSTNTDDLASAHLGDAPPVGVPVMILGATLGTALRGAYGPRCHALASRRARYDACLQALAGLAGGETNSPRAACRREPDAAGERACIRAARRLAGALR